VRQGLIIGKFYPPHEGHHFVIETALSECEHVTVLILANDSETIPGVVRADLLERSHPGPVKDGRLSVEYTRCNLPVDYTSRDADRAHAEFIFNTLYNGRHWPPFPHVLYSSEEYGERIASDLSELYSAEEHVPLAEHVSHRMVDLKRIAKPISATEIRRNPVAHWDTLRGPVRAYLTKRVVVCGAESSGTTTLTQALAERYQTIWVPEYGRTFSEALGNSHRWTSADFEHIIDEQHRLEDNLAQFAGPVMFCDTDGIATLMFHELYLRGRAPDEQWVKTTRRRSERSQYIITDHVGVDFEDDGYRLFEHQREWATGWLIDTLPEATIVTGPHDERMSIASQLVDLSMVWEFGPAGDELELVGE
jgi:HTH-type transcriptional regulator, transcriptional repressor of NAD biosynthesis genes